MVGGSLAKVVFGAARNRAANAATVLPWEEIVPTHDTLLGYFRSFVLLPPLFSRLDRLLFRLIPVVTEDH